jgi:dienelactone hydrolase
MPINLIICAVYLYSGFMIKSTILIPIALFFQPAWAQIHWMQVATDSGVIHAAVAIPKGAGPFPAIVILHGTHGFAEEYVKLARHIARNGVIGIAACWFAGRRGAGVRFITPIDCNDAPPLIDVPGSDRFRIARHTIDSLIRKVRKLPNVRADRLVLFGHSRGAGAALDYVLTHPGNVKGAILNSGGYPPEVTKRATEIGVPILILHGTADSPADGGSPFTNISMARQFEAALRAANKNVEVKYYERSEHNDIFSNSAQFDDAVQRISDFLQNKLFK